MGADLVAEWNGFTSLTSGDYTLQLSGSSTVDSTTGILSVVGSNPPSATIDVSEANLTLKGGFTLNMVVKNVSNAAANAALLTMSSSASDYFILAGVTSGSAYSDGKFAFNGSESNITTAGVGTNGAGTGATGVLPGATYSAVTLTFAQDQFLMYVNGELAATGTPGEGKVTETFASSVIESISFGCWAGGSDQSKLNEDIASFAIYRGVMTADEVAKLVPEPATATLSLLALAGLAMRRRRK